MLKRLLFLIFFLIGGVFFFYINEIKAEGICHINNCFVPAPTIVIPENNFITKETRPAIRGLTWKRTLVDIYLDGQYQGPVLLQEHENHLQSFFWQPSQNLIPGEHYIYTIAYNSRGYDKNLKGWDQSKESTYIYFTIKEEIFNPSLIPYNKIQNQIESSVEQITKTENLEEISEEDSLESSKGTISEDKKISNQNILEEEQRKKRRDQKIFGFGILIIFIIIFIANHYLRKKREYLDSIIKEIKSEKEKTDNQDDEYPPPPPSINQDSLGI